MYCAKCQIVLEDEGRCPVCGNKKVREPLPEDICFLTEANPIQAGILKDLLEQDGIPVLSSSTIGAAMAMRGGTLFERIRCYVRYEHLPKARETASLFEASL